MLENCDLINSLEQNALIINWHKHTLIMLDSNALKYVGFKCFNNFGFKYPNNVGKML